MDDESRERATKRPRLVGAFTPTTSVVEEGASATSDRVHLSDAWLHPLHDGRSTPQLTASSPYTCASNDARSPDIHLPDAGGPPPSEVCFGMLAALSLHGTAHPSVPVHNLAVSIGGARIWAASNEGQPVARIDERLGAILGKLSSSNEIGLQAYITTSVPSPSTSGAKKDAVKAEVVLNVNLYGRPSILSKLGSFLEACDLYLQDPRNCDRDVPYQNPHKVVNTAISTFELEQSRSLRFDEYTSAVDILREFEYDGVLEEVATPTALCTTLFRHQKQALGFMRQRERGWRFHASDPDIWTARSSAAGHTEYVNNLTDEKGPCPPQFRGGILADQMGLGKSLSAIALVAADIDDDGPLHPDAEILSPGRFYTTPSLTYRAPVIETWKTQLKHHVHDGRLSWEVHYDSHRMKSAQDIAKHHVILTSYHTLAIEFRKHDTCPSPIFQHAWHRIILDEAHDVRDPNNMLSQAVFAVRAPRRWAITGTPIQNSLTDVSGLFKFLKMPPYEQPDQFKRAIKRLSRNPRYHDGPERLRTMFRCIMLRRSIATVELPDKQDVVCRLQFSADEQVFYDRVASQGHSAAGDHDHLRPDDQPVNILHLINKLRTICNLGLLTTQNPLETPSRSTTPDGDWNEGSAQKCFNSLLMAGQASCRICGSDLSTAAAEAADDVGERETNSHLWSCMWIVCGGCWDKPEGKECHCGSAIRHPGAPVTTMSSSLSSVRLPSGQYMPTKVKALLTDIQQHIHEEKCIVFSFWTSTLDVVQDALRRRGISHIRFDGKQARGKRNKDLARFAKAPHIRVALLTISCGAVGLDLTAASRAYLMEPHWNPSVEHQALARIYRVGQRNKVTNVRFIMSGSFEEQILELQEKKEDLAKGLLSDLDSSSRQHDVAKMERLRQLLRAS